MIRLDEPGEGVAVIGSCTVGDEARAIASIFLYGTKVLTPRPPSRRIGRPGCVASTKVNASPLSMYGCVDC